MSALPDIRAKLSAYDITINIVIGAVVGVVTAAIIVVLALRKLKAKVMAQLDGDGTERRFRKRDKVMFYGRKMLRKVRSFTKTAGLIPRTDGRKLKKRQFVAKLARRLSKTVSSAGWLLSRKDSLPQLHVDNLPDAFLETEEIQGSDHRLPADIVYMLRSVRVFGHLEQPLFLELCRHVESLFVPAGSLLFKVGDLDDSIYVVQNGKISVYITDADGREDVIKNVTTGDSIHSLLSILDVMTGHPAPYKTVSAVAVSDSTVLRLPASAFLKIFENYPESMVRVVQVIMVRLQRVTFMALHNYLGLSTELIRPGNQGTDRASQQMSHPPNLPSRAASSNQKSMQDNPANQSSEPASANQGSESTANQKEPKSDPNYESDGASSKCSVFETASASSVSPAIPIKSPRRRGSISRPDGTSGRERLGRRVSDISDLKSFCAKRTTEDHDDQAPTDFDVALTQARLGSWKEADEDALAIGTPPSKPHQLHHSASWSDQMPQRRPSLPECMEQDSDSSVLLSATKAIQNILGIHDGRLLEGKLHLRHYRPHTTITAQEDNNVNLLYIVSGTLMCQQKVVGQEEKEHTLFVAHAGEMVGALAVLTGEPSFFSVRTRARAVIVEMGKKEVYSVMRQQPGVVLNAAHLCVARMSPFVRQIDFALDWMQIESGRPLYKQGDSGDCVYIILNGRLRNIVKQNNGKKDLLGEYGRGELIGIVEVLSQTERATSVVAVRDTELAKIPSELLSFIKAKHPHVVTRLIRLLSHRILGNLRAPSLSAPQSSVADAPYKERPLAANLATVAVVPISDDVPVSNFTLELQLALNAVGPTLRLTSEIITKRLGSNALDTVNEYRLSSWLGQQEDLHRMVLYQCDYRMSAWTQQCLRQADCILLVGLAENQPTMGHVEKQIESLGARAQKDLILLHHEDGEKPEKKKTVEWLNMRGWCSSHHHIRCPKRVFSKRSPERMLELYRKLFDAPPNRLTDFGRLARFLTGTSIGLVLGGGGARGIAHVGLIKCLTEAGVPIDMIGGTSIGSFVGAVWAEETQITRTIQRCREWSMEMKSWLKKIMDLTYPITSMFSGSAFNRSIETVLQDRQIEDLWIPYFAISTDISSSRMRVHTSGSLWRYVRSSMSLAGYLPPLCDPVDGHLLLDGGYVNNLPADVMRSMGANKVIAIDVGSEDITELTNFGDELSGWWLLWKRWWPWASGVRVPDMNEIQSRLAYVSCVRQLEVVRQSGYCEYVRPPIQRYGTLEFGRFDEIFEVGYNHGKTLLDGWTKSGFVDKLFVEHNEDDQRRQSLTRQHSKTNKKGSAGMVAETEFTDLAELVSQIQKPLFSISSDEDEDYLGDDEGLDEPEVTTSEPELGRSRDVMPMLHPLSEGDQDSEDADDTGDDVDSDFEKHMTEAEKSVRNRKHGRLNHP